MKKDINITLNSILFLSYPPHTKEKNTIKSDIISFFILPTLLNCDKMLISLLKKHQLHVMSETLKPVISSERDKNSIFYHS